MPVLPVIDLLGGQAVRGVAGRREEYRPVVSRLTDSAEPLAVAGALREHFGFDELYVADLDAIAGQPPALATYRAWHDAGFRLWVDAGLRRADDAQPLVAAGVSSVIAGLESIAGPSVLAELHESLGERLIFSLDLKGGRPLGRVEAWPSFEPWDIASDAVGLGVRRLLVLDLARVGMGEGAGTDALCTRLRAAHPTLQLIAGGGVRGADDVRRLYNCGVDYVLVASALHDGRLSPEALP